MHAEDILNFWFVETKPAQWWRRDAAFDALIERRFADLHRRAVACELSAWRTSPDGRLAEIIAIDQFARNLFREDARAFAHDPLALALAQEAVAASADAALQPQRKAFLYLPYMHSESLAIHDQAMRLYDQPGLENNLEFEIRHRDIIQRFGRYPHRNAVLGRESTPEEVEFLKQPGSSF